MIGSNLTLAPRSPVRPGPLAPGGMTPSAPATPAPQSAQQPFGRQIQKPKYISDDTVEDSVNNAMASGWQNADKRYLTKKMAGHGFSAGRGQDFVASQLASGAVSDAAMESAGIRSQAAEANAKMKQDYENARENERLAQQMASHSASQSAWAQEFAQQQAQQQLQMAMWDAQFRFMQALSQD